MLEALVWVGRQGCVLMNGVNDYILEDLKLNPVTTYTEDSNGSSKLADLRTYN